MISNFDFNISEVPNVFCEKLPNIITIHAKNIEYTSVGRGIDNEIRTITAFAEMVERYNLSNLQSDFISPYREDLNQLSPLAQLLPIGSTLDDRIVEWNKYKSLENNHYIYIHRPNNPKQYSSYFQHTSNGAAIHQTEKLAIKSASEEIIERHLFNIFWLFERNLYRYTFSDELTEFSYNLGWEIVFYTIVDSETCTICEMKNKSDTRFMPNGMVIGLSYGTGKESCLRAYSECLQILEVYLAFNKNINKSLLFYLSGNGTEDWLAKVNRSLLSTPVYITEKLLKNNQTYYLTKDTIHDLVYCEVVIPKLIPLQTDELNKIRIYDKSYKDIKDIPIYNPIG